MEKILGTAIRDNDISLVRDMISAGVNINKGHTPPICLAIREENMGKLIFNCYQTALD